MILFVYIQNAFLYNLQTQKMDFTIRKHCNFCKYANINVIKKI